ncbi:MAG: DNA repair protein RecN [Dehalococcoidia bacterium]
MLEELDIRDFVIADHLHLDFDPGFTAITGETGAGKSLVLDALGILLGDRPNGDVVRAGARVARIEGIFAVSAGDGELRAALAEAEVETEEGSLIISREVRSGGRSSARINGRAVVQSTLAAIGGHLVDIHSQSEHLSILRPSEHVKAIDRYAGSLVMRADLAAIVGELRRVRTETARLQQDARERTRREERLAYEVQEIEAATVIPDEEEDLRRERSRLANAEQLAQLAAQAYTALEGDGGQDETLGAADALGTAAGLLEQLARMDESLRTEATLIEALQSQVADVARTLRAYQEEIEHNPERLGQIEDRLATLLTLKRKYGATLAEVILYREHATKELEELGSSEERLTELQAHEADLMTRLAVAAMQLSCRRREAARRLSAAVERELADLGLARGRFGVQFELHDEADGVPIELPPLEIVGTGSAPETSGETRRTVAFDRTGVDKVELLVSLNPGEPLRPMARVASGGETSRLMLALKTILGKADSVPTLIFDEVEVGVGGRSGRIVGEKLAGLAGHHQVICITHLAQIASLAGRHLAISKEVEDERTSVTVRELTADDRLDEIAAMLGGVTTATRASARELLEKSL